jgi:hypothetical protein
VKPAAHRSRAGARPDRCLRPRRTATGLAVCLTLGLAGCVVVPHTREVYDAGCRTQARQMTLDVAVVGRLERCSGDACAAQLVAAGAVTVVSAVVSGSIALVGNVVYWIELQGRCNRRPPGATTPAGAAQGLPTAPAPARLDMPPAAPALPDGRPAVPAASPGPTAARAAPSGRRG